MISARKISVSVELLAAARGKRTTAESQLLVATLDPHHLVLGGEKVALSALTEVRVQEKRSAATIRFKKGSHEA